MVHDRQCISLRLGRARHGPAPFFHERTFIAAVGDPYRAVTLVKALLRKKPQETVRAVTGLSRNAVLGYKLKPGEVMRDADR